MLFSSMMMSKLKEKNKKKTKTKKKPPVMSQSALHIFERSPKPYIITQGSFPL